MKYLILALLFFASFGKAQIDYEANCQTYSIRCDCFPAVPLEGFKLHVVEKCDDKEEWSTEYYAPSFETDLECRSAIKTDPVCNNLK